MDDDLIIRYNYDAFVADNFMPWMRFDASPPLGESAPDFPIWDLEDKKTSLAAIWGQQIYTVVEFGSFT